MCEQCTTAAYNYIMPWLYRFLQCFIFVALATASIMDNLAPTNFDVLPQELADGYSFYRSISHLHLGDSVLHSRIRQQLKPHDASTFQQAPDALLCGWKSDPARARSFLEAVCSALHFKISLWHMNSPVVTTRPPNAPHHVSLRFCTGSNCNHQCSSMIPLDFGLTSDQGLFDGQRPADL